MKKVYIALIIIFTAVIGVSTLLHITAPATTDYSADGSSGGMPDFSESGEMPDMSEAPDFSGSGGMPDMSEMPDSSESGEMPDMSESGERPEHSNDDSSAVGGDTGFGESQKIDDISSGSSDESDSAQTSEDSSSLVSFVRDRWIAIDIVAGVLDILAVVMLVFTIRKDKKTKTEEVSDDTVDGTAAAVTATADGTVAVDENGVEASPHSRSKKKYLWLLLIIPVGAVVVLTIMAKQKTESGSYINIAETVLDAATGSSEIETSITGSGYIEAGESTSVSLAGTGIKVTSYAVSDGDVVSAGDLIAEVDRTSVMQAIEELEEVMSSLDEALDEASEDDDTDEITATADGRVMKIYVDDDENTSVIDTMYNDGALMLISLDGKLAADIEDNGSLSVGDSVIVTDDDGDEATGKIIAKNISDDGDTFTVVVDDDEFDYDEHVTISVENQDDESDTEDETDSDDDTDGDSYTVVGDANLYIHSELKVTGYIGTVTDVEVSEGDTVESGDTLITLDDTDYAGQYDDLKAKREKLEQQLAALLEVYETGCVYAEVDGEISGINEDILDVDEAEETSEAAEDEQTGDTSANNTTEADNTTDTASIEGMAYGETVTASVSNLLNTSVNEVTMLTIAESSDDTAPEKQEDKTYYDYIGQVVSISGTTIVVNSSADVTENVDYENITVDASTLDTEVTVTVDRTTKVYTYKSGKWTEGTITDINLDDILIFTYDEEGKLYWLIRNDADDTVVDDTGDDSESDKTDDESGSSVDIADSSNAASDSSNAASDSSSSASDSSSSASEGSATPTDAAESGTPGEQSQSASQDSSSHSHSGSSGESQDGFNAPSESSSTAAFGSSSSGSSSSGSSGGSSSGGAAVGDASSAAVTDTAEAVTTQTASYEVEETELCSVVSLESVTIDISVDELDITKISIGQSVSVQLDAIAGKEFEGEIYSIDTDGTNEGGNTKYTVTVQLDRDADMLAGMNATVTAVLGSGDYVSIPAEAIYEDAGRVYVYTSYDEETDTLGGECEIETGLSDGDMVEVISGISEGDTVYYKYADSIQYSFVE